MRYAILAADGVTVENVIVADEAFVDLAYPGRGVVVPTEVWCEPGSSYDPRAGTFTPPAQS